MAAQLRQQAQELKTRVHEAFWCEELETYALALDGNKQPCRVRSSNAGQCLFTGIADPDAAAAIKTGLMSDAFFCGWGIRTVASSESRYNPMSYHNGSVWPHDNALIGAGLAAYGFKKEALNVLVVLFDASMFMELNRLPELYCGFPRRRGEGPTLYPVACNPQAWSCGTARVNSRWSSPTARLYRNSAMARSVPNCLLVCSSALASVLPRASQLA